MIHRISRKFIGHKKVWGEMGYKMHKKWRESAFLSTLIYCIIDNQNHDHLFQWLLSKAVCHDEQIRPVGVYVNVSHLSTPSTVVLRWARILRLATSASTLISSSFCTLRSVCLSMKACGRSSRATCCSLWGFRNTRLGRSWRNALPFPWWCRERDNTNHMCYFYIL